MAKHEVEASIAEQFQTFLLPLFQNPAALRILVVSIIAILGLGGVGTPLYFKIESLQEEFNNEKSKAELMRSSTAIADTLKAYQERLPEKVEFIEWVADLRELGKTYNISVPTLAPALIDAKPDANGIQRLYIRSMLRGEFRNVLKFIGVLENRKERVQINDFNLQGTSADSKSSSCQISITMAVLLVTPIKKTPAEARTAAAEQHAAPAAKAPVAPPPAAKAPDAHPAAPAVPAKAAPPAKPLPVKPHPGKLPAPAAPPAAPAAAPAQTPAPRHSGKASSKFDFDEDTAAPAPANKVVKQAAPAAKTAQKKAQTGTSSKQSIVDEETE